MVLNLRPVWSESWLVGRLFSKLVGLLFSYSGSPVSAALRWNMSATFVSYYNTDYIHHYRIGNHTKISQGWFILTHELTDKLKFYVIFIRSINVKFSLEEARKIYTVIRNYASGMSALYRKLKFLIPLHRLATESHEQCFQKNHLKQN